MQWQFAGPDAGVGVPPPSLGGWPQGAASGSPMHPGLTPPPGYFGQNIMAGRPGSVTVQPGLHPALLGNMAPLGAMQEAAWQAQAQTPDRSVMPPLLLSRINKVVSQIETELSVAGVSPSAAGNGDGENLDRNFRGLAAMQEELDDLMRKNCKQSFTRQQPTLHHSEKGFHKGVPVATAFLDTTGDGVPDYKYVGLDMNMDGIPDALQAPGGPLSPRAVPEEDIEEERRLLRQQMEMLKNQCEKLEDLHRAMAVKSNKNNELDEKEFSALLDREQLLCGELAEAEAISATAVRQRRFAEEARVKQSNIDTQRIAELEQLLSNARVERAAADSKARQGAQDLARIADLEKALMAAERGGTSMQGQTQLEQQNRIYADRVGELHYELDQCRHAEARQAEALAAAHQMAGLQLELPPSEKKRSVAQHTLTRRRTVDPGVARDSGLGQHSRAPRHTVHHVGAAATPLFTESTHRQSYSLGHQSSHEGLDVHYSGSNSADEYWVDESVAHSTRHHASPYPPTIATTAPTHTTNGWPPIENSFVPDERSQSPTHRSTILHAHTGAGRPSMGNAFVLDERSHSPTHRSTIHHSQVGGGRPSMGNAFVPDERSHSPTHRIHHSHVGGGRPPMENAFVPDERSQSPTHRSTIHHSHVGGGRPPMENAFVPDERSHSPTHRSTIHHSHVGGGRPPIENAFVPDERSQSPTHRSTIHHSHNGGSMENAFVPDERSHSPNHRSTIHHSHVGGGGPPMENAFVPDERSHSPAYHSQQRDRFNTVQDANTGNARQGIPDERHVRFQARNSYGGMPVPGHSTASSDQGFGMDARYSVAPALVPSYTPASPAQHFGQGFDARHSTAGMPAPGHIQSAGSNDLGVSTRYSNAGMPVPGYSTASVEHGQGYGIASPEQRLGQGVEPRHSLGGMPVPQNRPSFSSKDGINARRTIAGIPGHSTASAQRGVDQGLSARHSVAGMPVPRHSHSMASSDHGVNLGRPSVDMPVRLTSAARNSSAGMPVLSHSHSAGSSDHGANARHSSVGMPVPGYSSASPQQGFDQGTNVRHSVPGIFDPADNPDAASSNPRHTIASIPVAGHSTDTPQRQQSNPRHSSVGMPAPGHGSDAGRHNPEPTFNNFAELRPAVDGNPHGENFPHPDYNPQQHRLSHISQAQGPPSHIDYLANQAIAQAAESTSHHDPHAQVAWEQSLTNGSQQHGQGTQQADPDPPASGSIDMEYSHCPDCLLEFKSPEPYDALCARCRQGVIDGRLEAPEPKLFRVFLSGSGNEAGTDMVALASTSLADAHAFVLDAGPKVYVWCGSSSTPLQNDKAHGLAKLLQMQRGPDCQVAPDIDSYFWQVLGQTAAHESHATSVTPPDTARSGSKGSADMVMEDLTGALSDDSHESEAPKVTHDLRRSSLE